MDFTVVAQAGLTQKEFAEVCGVSRITANTWVRGKMNPHRYIKTKVADLGDAQRRRHGRRQGEVLVRDRRL